jgi:hypothetical protein
MQLEDVGDVIATRILYMEEANESQRTITVRIGRPQPFPEPPDDYFVPYQIVGIGSEKVHYAAGIDAVQALQLVMRMIGDDMAAMNRDSAGAIHWEAGQNDHDLGFPCLQP